MQVWTHIDRYLLTLTNHLRWQSLLLYLREEFSELKNECSRRRLHRRASEHSKLLCLRLDIWKGVDGSLQTCRKLLLITCLFPEQVLCAQNPGASIASSPPKGAIALLCLQFWIWRLRKNPSYAVIQMTEPLRNKREQTSFWNWVRSSRRRRSNSPDFLNLQSRLATGYSTVTVGHIYSSTSATGVSRGIWHGSLVGVRRDLGVTGSLRTRRIFSHLSYRSLIQVYNSA